MTITGFNAFAYEASDVLIDKLKDTKHSLLAGIQQAESTSGPAISAKFEMDGSALSLSIYTAKDGIGVEAERNTLMELAGDPTQASWVPGTEVFKDKEHIARASAQLTLMQLTKKTLKDVVKEASYSQEGTVYSVTPMIKGGKAVLCVIKLFDGTSITVNDGRDCRRSRPKGIGLGRIWWSVSGPWCSFWLVDVRAVEGPVGRGFRRVRGVPFG